MNLIYSLIILFSLVGCSNLLYYPDNRQILDPKKMGLLEQDLWLKLEDQTDIHAWIFKANSSSSKGTIVYFHGNADNLSSHFASLAWVTESHYDLIIFDYPGFGRSDGKPNPKNTVLAGHAVLQWAAQNSSQPIIVYGQSLGGIVAARAVLDLKSKIKIRTLILDSSFNSYKQAAVSALSKSWITWLFQHLGYLLFDDEFAPASLAEIAPIPVLFIHAENDRIISSQFSKNMYLMAQDPKELWLIQEGKHGATFTINNREYRAKLLDYLKKIP